MQCDAFETRLQQLLDRRQAPDRDPALQIHAACCTECHALLQAQQLLLHGLELYDMPEPGPDFATCVLDHAQKEIARARRQPFHLPLALLALATSMLLVALPHFTRRQSRSRVPTSQVQPAPTNSTMPRKQLAAAKSARMLPPSSWGDLLTLYPEKIRRRHLQQVDRITDDLRPITQSFTTAAAALRRTIPVGKHRRKPTRPQAQLVTPTRAAQFS